MNRALLIGHNTLFSQLTYKSTLHDTSARKLEDGSATPLATHALDGTYASANYDCVNFDDIKLACYPPRVGANTPCSVDALYLSRRGAYLIEFKFDTASIENVTRKAYDSVMLMIEYDGYDFQRARRELSYLVVSTGVTDRITGASRALGRAKAYCREPWIKFRSMDDHWKVSSLEGVVVKEAFCMHPATFDYFAKLKGWK